MFVIRIRKLLLIVSVILFRGREGTQQISRPVNRPATPRNQIFLLKNDMYVNCEIEYVRLFNCNDFVEVYP